MSKVVRLLTRSVVPVVLLVGSVACGGDEPSGVDTPVDLPSDPTLAPFSVITADQGATLISEDPRVVVVDVRTAEEYAQGHIDNALNVDVQSPTFADEIGALARDGRYVVYCRSGNRSADAVRQMADLGFTEVYDMGGLQAWMAAGHDIVVP